MNILEKIIEVKQQEIGTIELQKRVIVNPNIFDIRSHFLKPDSVGLIAEFKRKSPSKGTINDWSLVTDVARGYANAGASAMSILTDEQFFGGHQNDLMDVTEIAAEFKMPILRKEFIISELQIKRSKQMGANMILLIAECLTKSQLQEFTLCAQELGLAVLTELHNPSEIDKLYEGTDLIGVNNRNLATFEVSIKRSIELLKDLPMQPLKIAESGISSPKIAAQLLQNGFHGLLIGEYFMKHTKPELACETFVTDVKNLLK
jgi:indole-3-glycerol phosphate synthase